MKRLKELREARGLTIRELADELGMASYSLISRYELGKAQYIEFEMLQKLCDYFNVTPNYLLGYEPTNSFNNSLFLQGCEDGNTNNSNKLKEEIKTLKVENKLLREICLRLSILIQEEKTDEQSS